MKTETPIINIKAIEKTLFGLSEAAQFTQTDDIGAMIDKLGEWSAQLAFVNAEWAKAKLALNRRKVEAYNTLSGSSVANQVYYAPSLAKDYVSAKCMDENYQTDLCERASRSLVHSIDAIRTAISAMKLEAQYVNQ